MLNKLIFQGFSRDDLPSEEWDRISAACKSTILVDSVNEPTSLEGADGLFVRLGATIDRGIIDRAPSLRVIGMFGTGYGRIDTGYARQRGVSVFNISDYATEGVAEFLYGALLSQMRELSRGQENARGGNYSESGFCGTELRGKTLGILGLGAIGGRVAEIGANGFSMNVLYWSRNRKPHHEGKNVIYKEVEDIISRADYLTLHLAINSETTGFLSSERLARLKDGATIINTAPMELIDLPSLEREVSSGRISLVLDHSDEMPPDDVARLVRCKSCIVYPPIAYVTREANANKVSTFVDNIVAAAEGRELPNIVN